MMKDEDVKSAAELCRRRRRVAATMRSRKKRGAAGWTRVCLELPSALKLAVLARANREGKSWSDVAREALAGWCAG